MTSLDLETLYEQLDLAVDGVYQEQPDWPCRACPVQHTKDNCCHTALFYVTFTEWEKLREHPFIQKNRTALRKKARRDLHGLRSQGLSTTDWSTTIAESGKGAVPYTCPLLSEGGRCQVYTHRPTVCRTYGVTSTDEGLYACPIVWEAAAGKEVAVIPLSAVLGELRNVATGPARPLVAWLAGE